MRGKEGRLVENSGTITIMGRSHNLYEMSDREIEELIRENKENPVKVKQLSDFLYRRRFELVTRYEVLTTREDKMNRGFFRDLLYALDKEVSPFNQILATDEKKIFVFYVLDENMLSLDEIGMKLGIQTRGENELKNKALICHILDLCHQALRKLYPDRFVSQERSFCPRPPGNHLAQIEIDKRLTALKKRVLKEDLKAALRESSGGGIGFAGRTQSTVIPDDGDGEIHQSEIKISKLNDPVPEGPEEGQRVEDSVEAKVERKSGVGEEISPNESPDTDTSNGSVVPETEELDEEGEGLQVEPDEEEELQTERHARIKRTIEERIRKERAAQETSKVIPSAGSEDHSGLLGKEVTRLMPGRRGRSKGSGNPSPTEQKMVDFARAFSDKEGYFNIGEVAKKAERLAIPEASSLVRKGYWEKTEIRGRYRLTEKARGADVGNPTIKREGGDDRSPEVMDIKLNLQQRLEELDKEREGIEKILQVINLAEGTEELRLILELAENPRAVEALQSLLEAS